MASRRVIVALRWMLTGMSAVACSSETSGPGTGAAGASGAEQPTNTAGLSGAPVAGSNVGGAPGDSGVPLAGAATLGGGGQGGAAGAGGAGTGGAAGAPAGAAGASGTGGQSTGGASGHGGGGGGGNAAQCQVVKQEYAAELEKQLGCTPNAANQCKDSVAAAPGCSCRVFMQPTDPFAIENLANITEGWYGADCENPSCPAMCTTATVGKCQADGNFAAGGRCVTP